MKSSFKGACCAALLTGAIACGNDADGAASGSRSALGQAYQNVGGEFVDVTCEDDAGESVEVDAGSPELDAGYEDCSSPPPDEPPPEPDAGYEDCAAPPSTEFPEDDAAVPPPPPSSPPPGYPPLDCAHGGMVGDIEVAFGCGAIAVSSCKDLSNVVIELADGARQKFDGLTGTTGSFSGAPGSTIVRAWIKAGANASGDGPGYGELFVAPPGSCD